jgi:tetratricopeptide (TPR) repeat protein
MSVKFFYNQGNKLFDSGEYVKAIKEYDRALEIAPNTPEVIYRKAEALYKLQIFADSAALFWCAYLFLKFRIEPLLMCGRALEMAGLSFQACKIFSLIKLNEIDSESQVFHISSLVRESRFREAYEILPSINNDSGFNAELLRGKIAHEFGTADIAEQHLRGLLLSDETGKVIDRLIGVYADLEKFGELDNLLDFAISRFSQSTEHQDYFIAQKKALELWKNSTGFDINLYRSNHRYEVIESAYYLARKKNDRTRITGGTFHTFKSLASYVMEEGVIAELGVRNGHSINILAQLFPNRKIYGFDSFEGIPDAWGDEPAGTYTTGGAFPHIATNVTLIQGWFNKTLPIFVKNHDEKIALLNIDCDIYSSTKDIFQYLGPKITEGTVIVFDEYIINKTWRDDEFRAFQEWVSENNIKYEYLSVSFFSKQVSVRILKCIT